MKQNSLNSFGKNTTNDKQIVFQCNILIVGADMKKNILLAFVIVLFFASAANAQVFERRNHDRWTSYINYNNDHLTCNAETVTKNNGMTSSLVLAFGQGISFPSVYFTIQMPGESYAFEVLTQGKMQIDLKEKNIVDYSITGLGEEMLFLVIPRFGDSFERAILRLLASIHTGREIRFYFSDDNYKNFLDFSLIGATAATTRAQDLCNSMR